MKHTGTSLLLVLSTIGPWATSTSAKGGVASASQPNDPKVFPVTVRDGLGREVTLRAVPKRIVSTVPSNTEMLYDLDLSDKVVGVTSHCGKTCDVSGKKVIGGWAEPAIVREIADLKPDLVVAFGGLQSPLAKEMEKRGIPTFVFFPATVDQTLRQILLVGAITGTAPKAQSIVTRCRKRIDELGEKLDNIPLPKRVKCLRLMSLEAMVVGGMSFQSDIIKKAGGVNVFADMDQAYPVVSLEDARQKDPDIIILNRDDEEKAVEWFSQQRGWRGLRASREGKVISISCDYICHPNTRIDKTVEMLSRRFYPQLFRDGE
jgi:iron complex transport system substrate-binding protein